MMKTVMPLNLVHQTNEANIKEIIMNFDLILGILQIVLIATTPLVFAGIGELVTEKSGVLNLGVEGMMLVGAVSAFIIFVITGS